MPYSDSELILLEIAEIVKRERDLSVDKALLNEITDQLAKHPIAKKVLESAELNIRHS